MKKLLFAGTFILVIGLQGRDAHAQVSDTCSRIAIVNYQEVLVDSGPTGRGEGLRYYLEKNPKSKVLLDEYQKRNRPKWQYSILSTVGFASLAYGVFNPDLDGTSGLWSRKGLITIGALFVSLSYLISRTRTYSNERLLQQAVNEYNKNSSPRIYFSPYGDINKQDGGVGLGVSIQTQF